MTQTRFDGVPTCTDGPFFSVAHVLNLFPMPLLDEDVQLYYGNRYATKNPGETARVKFLKLTGRVVSLSRSQGMLPYQALPYPDR